MTTLFNILVVIGLTAAPVGLLAAYLLLGRLRRHHPSLWFDLGSPSAFRKGFQDYGSIRKFVRSERCERLGDPVVKLFGTIYSASFWFLLVVLSSAIVLLVAIRLEG